MINYSFVGSIYAKTKSTELYSALYSISQQSLPCSVVILYIDGDLSGDHYSVIDFFADLIPIKLIQGNSHTPRGLGLALRSAMQEVTSDYALRFDADDISRSTRAYKLINFFKDNPSAAVLGSQAHEFCSQNCFSLMQKREVPCQCDDIYKTGMYKNPLNHPTVALKMSSYNNSPGYQHGAFYEDYILWLNMLEKGLKICNLPDVLVYQNTDGMYSRRSGLRLMSGELTLLSAKLKAYKITNPINKIYFKSTFLLRCMLRFLPSFALKIVYSIFLRSDFKF